MGGFVVACCESPRVFELVEAALDAVAQRVDMVIDGDLNLAVPACRDDGCGAPRLHIFTNMISIIAAISQKNLRLRAFRFHQRRKAGIIGGLACGDLDGYGQALAVRAEVNLGREATS